MPHPADRYMLYQAIVGAWPLDLAPNDHPGVASLAQRLWAWQLKALREAKVRTSWAAPCAEYETLCENYLHSILRTEGDNEAVSEIAAFVRLIAAGGAVNSLAQVLLRNTLPGVPDLYQGTEFWDYSLVDPDNRRPVDFAARRAALDALDEGVDSTTLLRNWRNGHIKQAVLARTLALRAEQPALFAHGACAPLPVLGEREGHVLAHVRALENQCVFVVVPRLCATHLMPPNPLHGALPELEPDFWRNTRIVLPHGHALTQLRDVLSGQMIPVGSGGDLAAVEVFQGWPVKLLVPA